MHSVQARLGIRAKLILLFVFIKVIPLLLLALLAWKGVTQMGSQVSERSAQMAGSVQDTVGQLSQVMSRESVRALDVKSRENIERLTTDTALAVADFLKARDKDVLLAASLEPTQAVFDQFLRNRKRALIEPGVWNLSPDGKAWVQVVAPILKAPELKSENPENQQDFNYRSAEQSYKRVDRPLYHEITLVGLDGQELIKASASKLLSAQLRNISDRKNTYAKAESYFAELKRLKPGEIYVSDVIGPYVRSHYYGSVTPEAALKAKVPFAPTSEAYSGKENPQGKRFQGIIRWATPLVKAGKVIAYITLALDHDHVMSFTDNLIPTEARYTAIPDAGNGNYAFMWDYQDRSIAHPRHQSIIGYNPETGMHETPWLEDSLYKSWKASATPLDKYLSGVPSFDHQSRTKKPSKELMQEGIRGLDCRYLNFAPQCQGWYDLTKQGGSGSFVILWSGVWKLTTAATIPYFTGQYGKTPRGFGYVTIGANVDEFHKAATVTKELLDRRVSDYGVQLKQADVETNNIISRSMQNTVLTLATSSAFMIGLVVLIAIWLANMLTSRVTQLADGLKKIEQGDLTYRIEKNSEDEMGHLSDSINRMADSVENSFQRVEEARMRAEEASRMKSVFLASMSHELRTPLNGILGFAELLKLDLQDPDQQSYAETIHASGQNLLSIVNNLLDLSKIEAGRLELKPVRTDIVALLAELAAQHGAHAQSKGLQLQSLPAADIPQDLLCDPARLRQVLNNLLDNAVKFTEQGTVQLSVEAVENKLRFTVTDTGIGINERQQAKLFEKFHQKDNFLTDDQSGAGLGLALAKELVVLMNGEMGFESTPGAGSRFYFTLPIS
jgi:signal transduction histidine kinase